MDLREVFKHDISFNPRTHSGCDKEDSYCLAVFIVSIHAPTRGATDAGEHGRAVLSVSIHAPTRGATKFLFNDISHRYVSIHAPTRGATSNRFQSTFSGLSFNPRTHSGCDYTSGEPKRYAILFQSTHPLGVRRKSGKIRSPKKCFNPRTHSGCDIVSVHVFIFIFQFQSTHPLGVRLKAHFYPSANYKFQSTHPLGVRL